MERIREILKKFDLDPDQRVTDPRIQNSLKKEIQENWRIEEDKLVTRYSFEDFKDSLNFVNKVGEISEDLYHHPKISFSWGWVKITISSHEEEGLTGKDFMLAKRIDDIA